VAHLFGFVNVLKPKGITSFDVIKHLRRTFGMKKIGHLGTLDPLASGVLPVAAGDATRLLEYLRDDKKYIATVKFGQNSTTCDEEGEKSEFTPPNFTQEQLIAALEEFRGDILQTPPAFSAIKIGGQKLYALARKGAPLPDIPPRSVSVYDIALLSTNSAAHTAQIEVHCSKGTYIRTLCADIGERPGVGGCMSSLRRIRAGNFSIDDSVTIEEADETKVIGIDEIFDFPKVLINENGRRLAENGNPIPMEYIVNGIPNNGRVFAYMNGNLLGIYDIHGEYMKPYIML
jgi:tRNA pseudouridine55 synthase